MPRVKRRGPATRRRTISDEERAALLGLSCPEDGNRVLHLFLHHAVRSGSQPNRWRALAEEAWEHGEDELLAEWIRAHPGTRPFGWWELSAPRWEDDPFGGWWLSGLLPAPRHRLGGTGDPAWQCLNVAPSYRLGVPTSFIRARDLETWPRLLNREHYREAEAFDPADPPLYESQAAYLRRHDLLQDGEEERLPADAFEPVAVSLEEDAAG